MVDLLNLLERYGFLPSAMRWQEIRQMRNQIAHEYAMTPAELAVALELAFAMVGEMADLLGRFREAAIRHRTIPT